MTISPERLREFSGEKFHIPNILRRLDAEAESTSDPSVRTFCKLLGRLILGYDRELEQARTTLEGVAKGTHVIVPRAVTADMTEAGYRAYYETPAGISCDPFLLHRFAAVWSAMLAPEKEPAQENRATNLCDGSVCSCGWCPALMEAEKSAKQGGEADMSEAHGMNYGHGHVFPRPDGAKARCGGPGICSVCAKEAERAKAATSPTESGTPRTTAEKNQRAIEKFKCPVVIEAEQLVKFVEAERQLAEKQGLLEAETILRREWCKLAGERAGELTAERRRAEGLKAALEKYGDHTEDCDIMLVGPVNGPYEVLKPCTCGLDAALAAGQP